MAGKLLSRSSDNRRSENPSSYDSGIQTPRDSYVSKCSVLTHVVDEMLWSMLDTDDEQICDPVDAQPPPDETPSRLNENDEPGTGIAEKNSNESTIVKPKRSRRVKKQADTNMIS